MAERGVPVWGGLCAISLLAAGCADVDSASAGGAGSTSRGGGGAGATTSTSTTTSSGGVGGAMSTGGTAGSGAVGGAGGQAGSLTTSGGQAGSGPACDAPYADCDGLAENGCETDTGSSIFHCGGCGIECAPAFEADPFCQAGACVLACHPEDDDCDGDPTNGCEVELEEDLANCGACGHVCGPQNDTPECYDGACLFTCDAGYEDCDGIAENGCEADLLADPDRCGTCATECPSGVCAAGVCQP